MIFAGSHILSIDQFERDDINRIFSVADLMEPYAQRKKMTKVLDGAILGSMFFEPSTRTRVSFGCAFNLLGGEVRETTGFEHTAIAKGESLYDTARVMSGYSDAIVMRHPQAWSVAEFASASRVPVLNGGDGANEHPSQALLDLYTIRKELIGKNKGVDGMRLAMIGDLKFGRTVHSICKLLSVFKDLSITLISPRELAMPEDIVEQLRACGHEVIESDNMEQNISDVDILILGINAPWPRGCINSDFHNSYYKKFIPWIKKISTEFPDKNILYKHHNNFPGDSREAKLLSNSNIKVIIDDKNLNSYAWAFKSKLILSFASTMVVELLGNNKEAYFIDPGGINDQWFYGIKQLNKYKINDYKSLKNLVLKKNYKSYRIPPKKRNYYCLKSSNTIENISKFLKQS